jgi:hypothetical protein
MVTLQRFGKYLCERGVMYGIIDAVCPQLHFKLKQLLTSFQGELNV